MTKTVKYNQPTPGLCERCGHVHPYPNAVGLVGFGHYLMWCKANPKPVSEWENSQAFIDKISTQWVNPFGKKKP
jgi:hypothetical protein